MKSNETMKQANIAKRDEFYTQLPDIENELQHYEHHFKDKIVYCNCDDPRVSNFFKFFADNFQQLGLKKLITTCYKNSQIDMFSQNNDARAVYLIYKGDKNQRMEVDKNKIVINKLEGNGDFRSRECQDLLKQSDIVCTNPPFLLDKKPNRVLLGKCTNKKYYSLGLSLLILKSDLIFKRTGPKIQ